MKELETAKNLVEKENIADAVKTNQKKIIKINKIITFMILTDSLGEIPFTEAINPEFN